MRSLAGGMLMVGLTIVPGKASAVSFLESYPSLEKLVFVEPDSNFVLGFGIAPVGVAADRYYSSVSALQLHWITELWDIELFNASFGMSKGQDRYSSSINYTFRTSPKIRVFERLSVGGVVGMEYISFPDVDSKLVSGQYSTPTEPFSSMGPVYGIALSEMFEYKTTKYLKINQVAYKQSYSTKKSKDGWTYKYSRDELENDPERKAIAPAWVIAVEFSLLY